MSLKNIYARIPQVYFEKLSALAEIRNQSSSELIRSIVLSFFETVEQATDEVIFDDTDIHQKTQQFTTDAYAQTLQASRLESEVEELDW